jgi:signal transduction histidine kinase
MKRILVVDDSPTQAERLRLLLAGEGYHVDTAPSGRDGLRQATADAPDLVISDVTMPGMDGYEFCRTLKSAAATRSIPFILLTSRTAPADIITGLECGADNFIPKTFDDGYLLERVRRVFHELEHRKQNRLDMEVVLTVGHRKILVTADRQQIVELLFSTIEQLSRQHDELATAYRELERARARAEQANQAKSQFLAWVSHEVRTPLHAMLGFAQLLDDASLTGEDQTAVSMILSAGQHILNLINDLLDIARIEQGKLTLNPEPIPIEQLLQETTQLLLPLAAQRGITVSSREPGTPLAVLADRQRLKQILINLISNAIKYNTAGGTVTIVHGPVPGNHARIEITDTGPGIIPDKLDRLFSPFDRLDADHTPEIEGTGLGLTLSKQLATAMGGTLGVHSETGHGSTFWIQFTLTP